MLQELLSQRVQEEQNLTWQDYTPHKKVEGYTSNPLKMGSEFAVNNGLYASLAQAVCRNMNKDQHSCSIILCEYLVVVQVSVGAEIFSFNQTFQEI